MARLVRVFQAETHPGKEFEFQEFFLHEALPMVRSYRGLVSVVIGLPHERTPNLFSMISTWSGIEALKEFAGEEWSEAVIDPREAHLLARVSVEHFWEVEG